MFKNLFFRSAAQDANTIEFEDFAQAADLGEVTVVDVREPQEFAAGRVPKAVNMPMSRFDARQLPSGKPVILICQAGGRSRNALNHARAAGRDDVRHYAGGMNGWRSRGGDVEM